MAEGDKVYAGLGPVETVPKVNRAFDARDPRDPMSPEEYFVLTRIDGRTSLHKLVLISGFAEVQAIGILKRLRGRGAMLFPGEIVPPPEVLTPPPPPPPPPPAAAAPRRDGPAIDPGDARLAEDVELTAAQKHSILSKHLSLRGATYFQVLEVPDSADKKAVKAAYGKISKDFHPDRFFGRRLGSYKAMLSEIFDLASSAKETLLDPEQREAYVDAQTGPAHKKSASGDGPAAGGSGAGGPAQTSQASRRAQSSPPSAPAAPSLASRTRAAELFEEACMDHVSGELTKALEKFGVAIGVDPQPRYLRRAAECAIKAQELRVAEEYAKKATEMDAHNAASHRILGKVLAAAGRPADARLRFEQARRLDPDNPHIAAELRELDDSLR